MKKIISLMMLIVFVLTTFSTFAFADEIQVKDMFVDMPDNWATDALVAAVENGLISGSDGYIKPDDFMTRAEMAAIISRATGCQTEADISEFTDVTKDDWYYSPMAKAVYMKGFKGSDGMLNPENNITRQEAFVVLARVFGIATNPVSDYSAIDVFTDKDQIADWAKDSMNMIIREGYVGGNDGRVNPLDNITRAEFAVVMNRLVKYYIDEPGDYTPNADGNIMIRCGGVNINKFSTDKMIVVGDIKGEDAVNFVDCNIQGTVVTRGGKTKFTGDYASMKAIMKASTIDVSELSKEVMNKIKIHLDEANIHMKIYMEQ